MRVFLFFFLRFARDPLSDSALFFERKSILRLLGFVKRFRLPTSRRSLNAAAERLGEKDMRDARPGVPFSPSQQITSHGIESAPNRLKPVGLQMSWR